jgi:predicted RNA binding protein YcfA (HicA-like mRNA interferase family)
MAVKSLFTFCLYRCIILSSEGILNMQPKKTYDKIMSGHSDNNINFNDLQSLLNYLGFQHKHTKGDHFIYFYKDIEDIINIQPIGNKAKSYQIRQIRYFMEQNNIEL